jgi:hypothetical protein
MEELRDYGWIEKVAHPMSGYNGDYDFCKFVGAVFIMDNGKYMAQITETVYHGDEDDEMFEYREDIDENSVVTTKSPEFENVKETEKWFDEFDMDYQG